MTQTRRRGRSLTAYLAVTRIAVRRRLREPLPLATRILFFVLILFVFSRIWRILLDGEQAGPSAVESVWYLAVTEWITIPQTRVHVDIEHDVRTGDLAHLVNRPVSYLGFKIAEALGDLLISMLVLTIVGGPIAYALAGGLPAHPSGLWLALPLGVMAAVFALLCHVGIGLSSFWLHDCSPIYWVWQKATFVLGGLMVPLVLYPDWLRSLASWTPFSAMLSGPGSMVFSEHGGHALHAALTLLGWIAVAAVIVRVLYLRGLRALVLNGG